MIGLFVREDKNKIIDGCFGAIREGLQALGVDYFVEYERDYRPCEVAVVFSMFKEATKSFARRDIYNKQEELGHRLLVLERGFINRDVYHSVGWNAINGAADFQNKDMPSDRFEELNVKIKDWREDGSHIVLCSQVPWDVNVQYSHHVMWCNEIVMALRGLTNREIVFRPHPTKPQAVPPPHGTTVSFKPFMEDLKDAWAVVCYNSNSAVEAIMEGVPAFVSNNTCMAWPIANKKLSDIERPILHKRQQWANDLSYAQWTYEEIKQGLPLRHLGVV